MKRKYLAFLVLTLLTFMFVGKSDVVKAQGPCGTADCTPDPNFQQGFVNYHISAVFDPFTLTFCTIRTKTKLYKFNCPQPTSTPTYYRYEIESIEVFGACTGLNQSQLTQRAIRSIISSNTGSSLTPAWIGSYSCAEITGTSPNRQIVSCGSECCRIKFVSTWDQYGGTLDSISKSYPNTCTPPGWCIDQCGDDAILPPVGDLETYNYIPQACFSSCGTIYDPIYRAVTNISSDMIYADYSLGTNNGTPCFSFHWVNFEGTHDLDDVLVRLIKKILKDIYDDQGNPNYIILNIAACWQQPHSGINLYYPCSQDDCCTLTFEIQSSTSAILDSYDHLDYDCTSPCTTEVCDIYTEFQSSFTIGKSSLQFDLDPINNEIKMMPNPNSGTFNLEFNATVNEQHSIQVINITGVEVFSAVLNPTIGLNQMNIDLTSLPTGVYYLQIINKGKVESKIKFLKN